ncbi:MAG: ATP-binding cassette domain-containing protein, partial [Gammaproteobacteria bacterium]|nr:ATP-binding cassette domain-containing protein [Gammaproteobacteria bacterium]
LNLLPTLTVEENVLLPLELNGLGDRVDEALGRLDALGIADLARRFPDALSGGEQQRVAIARALAHAPAVVLADEPTGNLDADNAARVADCLWDQVRDAGAGLVLATHNERLAERADIVVRLRQ